MNCDRVPNGTIVHRLAVLSRSLTEKTRLTKVNHGEVFLQIVLHGCSREDDATARVNLVQTAGDAALRVFAKEKRTI